MFGASGGTGRAVVAEAVRREIGVRALVRETSAWRAPEGVACVRGSILDPRAVAATIGEAPAVVVVIGPRPPYRDVFCSESTQIIIEAMRASGARRLVCQTGAMVGRDLSRISIPMRAMAAMFRRSRPEVAADSANQEALVKASGLEWTLVKPPRLADGAATGRVRLGTSLKVGLGSSDRRADLAAAILDLVARGDHVGEAIYVVGA